MDGARFDTISRALVASGSRRAALRALAGGALGALLGRRRAAAACKKVGRPCAKAGECCTGGRCRRGKCRCRPGWPTCAKACCLPGATVSGIDGCVNGGKQPGEPCDPAAPGACASGTCGCSIPGDCSCRAAGCGGTGGVCGVGSECCAGSCAATACSGGGKRCCLNPGGSCKAACDCCGTQQACHGGTCCLIEGAGCSADAQCCGALVCQGVCAQP